MGDLSKNFDSSEFKCPCCGAVRMDKTFILMLQQLRDVINRPLKINSGYRCKKHNTEVGGEDNSAHLLGCAADISCLDSTFRLDLIAIAINMGMRRIGVGRHFIHLDTANRVKPGCYPEGIWAY